MSAEPRVAEDAVPPPLAGAAVIDLESGDTDVAKRGGGWRSHPYRLGLVGLVVVALVVALLTRSSDGSTATVGTTTQVVTVSRGSMSETVSAEGTVAAAQTDDLSFSASGTVTAVNVKAGDKVTKGQVLAKMSSAELSAAVISAESTVAQAEAQLSDDQSSGASSEQIAADQASLTAANDSLGSAKLTLAGTSLVATFDGTVATVDLTVGEQLASGGTGATSATGSGSGSGASAASRSASNSTGFGSAATSASSASSSSSTPQIEVVSKGSYTVSLPVGTSDIAAVSVGQIATLTVTTSSSSSSGGFPGFGGGAFPGGFPGVGGGGGTGISNNRSGSNGNGSATNGSNGLQATGATATGRVTDVAKVADTSSGVAQYPVTVAFTAGSSDIYVGSTVTGAVTTATRTNVLQVPVRAVTTSNGRSTVVVTKNGRASGPTETRTVTTGLTSNGMVEIKHGLKAGDKVLVTGFSFGGTGTTPGAGGGGFPGGFPGRTQSGQGGG